MKTDNYPVQPTPVQPTPVQLTPVQLTPGKLLRINQIIPDIIPTCKSQWWDGVRRGIYPASVKLGPKITAWRSEDIIELIKNGVPSK